MKIGTKLVINIGLFVVFSLAVLGGIVMLTSNVEKSIQNNALVEQILDSFNDLNVVTYSYALNRGERPRMQWELKHASLEKLLQRVTTEENATLARMVENHKLAKTLFDQLIRKDQDRTSPAFRSDVDEETERIVSQLIARTQMMRADALALKHASNASLLSTHREWFFIVMGIIIVMLGIVTSTSFLLKNRITGSLNTLYRGTEIIRAGNLDHRTGIATKDEIGRLSSSFDHMAEDLKNTMVSRDALQTEVEERRRAEREIRRRNKIQEAINRIFEKALTCDTEEELGRMCLSVVEELTDSKFSFVGEIGEDGWLHDIAISNPGWELCTMYDKTGHRRSPGAFKIHGLYGRVLREGKSLLTNDPASHPDSIGVPEGHPPLTAFLGVPFIQGGKSIGMVAVGNRELGYTQEQQQDLGALVPVIFQAHLRKSAEEGLRQSEQRWATTLASIGDGVIATDVDGRITFMNAVAESLTGWTLKEASQVPTAEVFRIINEQTRKEVENPITKVLRAGNVIGLGNHTLLIRKDGTEVAIDDSGAPIKDQDGKIVGVVLVFRDITERKAAEEALRASERKYRNLFENIEEMVTVYEVEQDDGGRIIERRLRDANRAFLRAVGVSSVNEIRGKTSSQIFGKVWSESHLPAVQGAMDTGQVQMQEVYRPESDRHYITSVVRLDTYTYLSTGWDITERKRVEEALLESERRERERAEELAAVLDATPIPIFLAHDPNCLHITGNRAADDLLRNPRGGEASLDAPAEIKPQHFRTFKDGRELDNEELPAQRAARGFPVRDFEFNLVFDDGTARHVVGDGAPLEDQEGRPRGGVLVLTDITERKQMEEELRRSHDELETRVQERTAELMSVVETLQDEMSERKQVELALREASLYARSLIEASLDPLVTISRDGKIMDVNRATELATGLSRDTLIGSDFLDYFIEPEKAREGYKQVFSKGFVRDYPLAIRHTSGKITDVLYNAAVYRNEAGEVQGVFAAARDITKRKRAEEALRESENRLRLLSTALLNVQERERKMIAGEIHDGLGASLAATKFKVETALTEMGDDHPQTKVALESVISIVQGTIEEARRIQMSLRPSILDDLGILPTINWSCRQFESIYPAIRITREIDIEEDEVPKSLKIVIYRVLQEALNNIAKHSKTSVVLLSFRKTDQAIELVIRDSGHGFNPEEAYSRKGASKGLGLDSMRERTELSGGSFNIESAEGKGTSIFASWPLGQNA